MTTIQPRYRPSWNEFWVEPMIRDEYYTSINTSNPISHGVHAREFRISMRHGLKFIFTSLKSLLLSGTSRSAYFKKEIFRILSILNHGLDFSLYFRHSFNIIIINQVSEGFIYLLNLNSTKILN